MLSWFNTGRQRFTYSSYPRFTYAVILVFHLFHHTLGSPTTQSYPWFTYCIILSVHLHTSSYPRFTYLFIIFIFFIQLHPLCFIGKSHSRNLNSSNEDCVKRAKNKFIGRTIKIEKILNMKAGHQVKVLLFLVHFQKQVHSQNSETQFQSIQLSKK